MRGPAARYKRDFIQASLPNAILLGDEKNAEPHTLAASEYSHSTGRERLHALIFAKNPAVLDIAE
jgi:hypothetical protein